MTWKNHAPYFPGSSEGPIRLWLDDNREPWRHGCLGWTWAKTAAEAIALIDAHEIVEASLDHDLTPEASAGMACPEPTGYDVVQHMAETGRWPTNGCSVHSANPEGAKRMRRLLARHGKLREGRP